MRLDLLQRKINMLLSTESIENKILLSTTDGLSLDGPSFFCREVGNRRVVFVFNTRFLKEAQRAQRKDGLEIYEGGKYPVEIFLFV